MSDRTVRRVVAVLGTIICVLLSFALARIGEPTSLWLWRDVLGTL